MSTKSFASSSVRIFEQLGILRIQKKKKKKKKKKNKKKKKKKKKKKMRLIKTVFFSQIKFITTTKRDWQS